MGWAQELKEWRKRDRGAARGGGAVRPADGRRGPACEPRPSGERRVRGSVEAHALGADTVDGVEVGHHLGDVGLRPTAVEDDNAEG